MIPNKIRTFLSILYGKKVTNGQLNMKTSAQIEKNKPIYVYDSPNSDSRNAKIGFRKSTLNQPIEPINATIV